MNNAWTQLSNEMATAVVFADNHILTPGSPLAPADEPRPGHLAMAVGRTWSGGVMAAFAPVAVVGGPPMACRIVRSPAPSASASTQ